MHALNRKLIRDLWQIKTQVLTISLVIGSGVAMWIAYLSAFDSLRLTQDAYYERYRFAHVFSSLASAPLNLKERIAQIPGVNQVETRLVVDISLDMESLSEPAMARLISIPANRQRTLNDLVIRRGRYIEEYRFNEVLISEAFANAHTLDPGDTVNALVNGRRRELEVVGIALSPEYIYSIRPGELIPDDERFGIFWMEYRGLAAAFDMEGSFNDVSVTLTSDTYDQDVIAQLDRILEGYGSLGSIPRDLQLSHWSLDNELSGLQSMGRIVPLIFMAIAAFLLNVVLTRIVKVQRGQIAILKAIGYKTRVIASHYLKWALAIGIVGTVLGGIAGAALGLAMMSLYNNFFRFPVLEYQILPGVVIGAITTSFLAATIGAYQAVQSAIQLPPAEAMRPQAPARYRKSWTERSGLIQLFSSASRIILRNIQRHPVRTLASILGVALAAAILVVGTFAIDSINVITDVQFNKAKRQDVTLSFSGPQSAQALYEVERLPGVTSTEPFRSIPVRLHFGHRSRQTMLLGLDEQPQLNRVIDSKSMISKTLPQSGLLLSTTLADVLNVKEGDTVIVEVLESHRPVQNFVVADLVDELMGISAYVEISTLHRLMRESNTLSGSFITVDEANQASLYSTLKLIPEIDSVTITSAMLQSFQNTFEENINIFVFFNILFSSIIAFGVVYNAAHVSLSERIHELASLRVLGFTRKEVSFILLGELVVITFIAVPLGLGIGYGLSALVVSAFSTELYQLPLAVSSTTYARSSMTVIVAVILSSLVVRRRLDTMKLVEVLKSPQ